MKTIDFDTIEDIKFEINSSIGWKELSRKVDGILKKYKDVKVYYEDKDFSKLNNRELDIGKSYPESVYLEDFNLKDNKKIEQRYNRALGYKKKGNIDKFYEIANEILQKYPLNIYAARFAYEIGEFEEEIYNLEVAEKYFRYVIVNHFNSEIGPKAYIRYAGVLEKQGYFLKSEFMLLSVLKNPLFRNYYLDILRLMSENISKRIIWFWNKKEYKVVEYYLGIMDQINEYSELYNPYDFIRNN